jgi:hypothetical protein
MAAGCGREAEVPDHKVRARASGALRREESQKVSRLITRKVKLPILKGWDDDAYIGFIGMWSLAFGVYSGILVINLSRDEIPWIFRKAARSGNTFRPLPANHPNIHTEKKARQYNRNDD